MRRSLFRVQLPSNVCGVVLGKKPSPMKTKNLSRMLLGIVSSSALVATVAQAAEVYTPGVMMRRFWNLPGLNNDWRNVTNNVRYPDAPDRTDYVAEMGSPQTADPNIENYGLVLSGLVTPPTTGQYIFYVSGDDNCALYLSTDDSPANKKLIAVEPEWNGFKGWTTADRRPVSANLDPKQVRPNTSLPVQLTANKRYYIEAIVKEGGGGDALSVGWTQGTTPATTDDEVAILDASVIGTMAPNAPAFRIEPKDGTVLQNRPAQLSAFGLGTPANNLAADPTKIAPVTTLQWFQNDKAIDGATNSELTSSILTAAGSAKFYAVLTDGAQKATSRVATITVSADAVAPQLAKAVSSASFDTVVVTFDEGMTAGPLGTAANYTISGGVSVSKVDVLSDREVRLTTSRQPGDQEYTLTVNNVTDLAGNKIAAGANTTKFRSFVFRSGLVVYERWNNVTGAWADATNVVNVRKPDVTGVEPRFQAPTGVADNYLGRLTTYIVPAKTGDHVIFISADDHAEFFLSTDENPANLKRVAVEPTWNDPRQWLVTDRRNADGPENRTDTFAETEWPTGNTLTLTAGKKYLAQLYFQEGGGGDNGGATIKLASEADPANGSDSSLTGALVGNFIDPLSLPPIVKTAPAGQDFAPGSTLTLSVEVDSARPLTNVQWYRNKVAVPGATNTTLAIANAGVDAIGDYYVVVANVNGSANTQPDDNCRVLMKGGFVVEAEDYNQGGGKTVAAANTQPVGASLYAGLDGLPGIDFHLENQSTTAAGSNGNSYRNGYNDASGTAIDFPTAPEELGNPDVAGDDGNTNHRRRGDYTATVNYKIGWNSAGEWYNYTRNFAPGKYSAVLAASRDVSDANRIQNNLELVTAGVTTTSQTTTVLGSIKANGTGGWSSLDILPYRNADGSVATFTLGANSTVRVKNVSTGEDHDLDYLIFYPVTESTAGISNLKAAVGANGKVKITFDGTGTVQTSTTLNGTYADSTLKSGDEITADGSSLFIRAKR